MVDVVGGLRVEVPDRVVADGREVDHGVEADQILALDVTDIRLQRLDLGHRGPKVQAAKRSESSPTTSWPARSSAGTSTEPM